MTNYVFTTIASPVGRLKLIGSDDGLAAVLWENDDPRRVRVRTDTQDDGHPILAQTAQELREYFAGERTVFSVPLDFVGTEFQTRVWHGLLTIPFGQTRTYGDLARWIGDANGARAVGAANGRNPISIISPCHRVIGASGDLTGFAGGLAVKRYLLALEQRQTPPSRLFD